MHGTPTISAAMSALNAEKDRRINFVILTWNSEKYIEACLKSLLALNEMEISVYVIDNGSTDRTRAMVRHFMEENNKRPNFNSDLVELPRNIGTTASRNIGFRRILQAGKEEKRQYVCVLDSDTVVNQKAILIMLDELEQRKSIGIIGPRMADSSGSVHRAGRNIPTMQEKMRSALPCKRSKVCRGALEEKDEWDTDEIKPVGYLLSACWLMRLEVLNTVGLMDEKIFYAPEDAEYCIRVWKAGYGVLYCPQAEIIHEWQRISRKKIFSKHNYEHIKGLLYMFIKHRYLFNARPIDQIIDAYQAERNDPPLGSRTS